MSTASSTAGSPMRRARRDPLPRTPRRVQLRRTPGWRKPDGAIVVARPTRWGNPYRVVHVDDLWPWAVRDDLGLVYGQYGTRVDAARRAVDLFRAGLSSPGGTGPTVEEVRELLAGADLACWCPLVDAAGEPWPCHADVLLEVANGGQA